MPPYWFESRRRYFMATHGTFYAVVADVTALAAHGFGWLKRVALGRQASGTADFVMNLLWHTPLCARNRALPAIKHFVPNSSR